MQLKQVADKDRNKWDAFIETQPNFSLLQSWNWGVFKETLGWKAGRIALEDNGRLVAAAQLLIKPLPLGLSIAYVPRGPVGAWINAEAAGALLPELCRCAREQGAILLKVEPPVGNEVEAGKFLEGNGFHASPVTNQPRATILLDLCQGEADILQQMRKKTRQYIRRAGREGICVRVGDAEDLPAFSELMRLTGKREGFAARTSKYYETQWKTLSRDGRGALLLAYHEDRLIAARMVYRFGQRAAEFHAGSLLVPGLHANYLLVWEAIKWAIANGCVEYDLWGVPDELAEAPEEEQRAHENDGGLWGVYQFKRGFSRNVRSYVGAYDSVLMPALYPVFNSALFRGKWWEQAAAVLDLLQFGSSKPGI